MSAGETEPVGTLDELAQADDRPALPIAAVPVELAGPVQTHELPSRSGGLRSYSLTATEAVRVVNADQRRRRVTLIAITNDVCLGTDQASAQASTAGQWPDEVPMVWTAQDELWARSATATATLTVVAENWAD